MKLLNDQPALFDTLDRLTLVHEVGDAIAECEPPQVFGIHGDWGQGKTSFLRQLEWYLVGDDKEPDAGPVGPAQPVKARHKDRVVVVWFEAWRYQNEAVPIVALLQEIRGQFAWQAKLSTEARKLASVAIRGALLAMDDLSKRIGVQAGKVEEAGERWEREHFASVLPSNAIQDQLEEAIRKLVGQGKDGDKRLVVLIDDLDRCEPGAAFKLLEGLKLYLNLRNCVFVLGMNQKVIEDALGSAGPEKGSGREARWAAAYLDKLCQVIWRLPLVRGRKACLRAWLPESAPRLHAFLEDDLFEDGCLPPNPRKLKAFANVLPRYEARLGLDPKDEASRLEFRVMLVVAYIFQFHHALYRHLEADPVLFDKVCGWARGADQVPEVVKNLKRLVTLTELQGSATPEFELSSAHPDPSDPDVFWMQNAARKIPFGVDLAIVRKFL